MRNRAPKTPAEQSRQTAPASSKSFTACAANYSIFKVPEHFLSLGVPVIEPPSCAVRFPPFSPPQPGSGFSRVPALRVSLSDKGTESAKSCTFACNFSRNNFHLTFICAEYCTPPLIQKTQHRQSDAVFFLLFRQIPVMSEDKRIFAPARSAVRSCTANDSRRDQNLRLRAASDFFLRLTEGFS